MKRLLPLPVLLLLALPLLAQEGDEAPAEDAPTQEAAPQEDQPAPAENDGAANTDTMPAAEPNSNDTQPAEDAVEGETPDEKPAKGEALISVKVSPPPVEEGDEEDITPPVAKPKVVPTATLMKAPKKGKPAKSAKGVKVAKGAKGKVTTPDVVKTKAPAIATEPPPPPIPAVPLTPITPRNP